jgi:hypothetical protein
MFVGTFIGKKLAKTWNWTVKRRAPCVKCGAECGTEESLAKHYRSNHGLAVTFEQGVAVAHAPKTVSP